MGDYAITAQVVLMETLTADPLTLSDRCATAVLTDGTFFVAAKIYTHVGILIRLWHLSPTLAVLGTMDIDRFVTNPDTEGWPIAVATSSNQVLLACAGEFFVHDSFHVNQYSWIIDCSDAVPAVMTTHSFYNTFTVVGEYDQYQHSTLYDPATGRVFIGSYGSFHSALEVFSGTTGERLAVAAAADGHSGLGCIGLYLNPTDSTEVAYLDPFVRAVYPGPGVARAHTFTVSLDGTSIAYTGSVTVPNASDSSWNMAGGSPYIPGGPGLIAGSPDYYHMDYYDSTGDALLTSTPPSGSTYAVNWYGDMVSWGSAKNLIACYEMPTHGYGYGQPLRGNLFCVDQSQPPVLQELPLPYFGTSGGNSNGSGGVTSMAAAESGVILIASTVDADDRSLSSILVWVVQGSPLPNLSGGPLGVEVHFDPR